jgi:hypothetical protein
VKLTDLSTNALHQAVSRGTLEPGNLRSLIKWLSRHAEPELKREIVRHALYEDAEYVHNKAKQKTTKKKKKTPT